MPQTRKERAGKLKLKQPDRSGPDPSRETLLEMAEKLGVLKAQQAGENSGTIESQEDEDPPIGRLGEAILWSSSLTMLHFTLDVLVSNQYAVAIKWSDLARRAAQAFPVILLLFYSFHPHPSPPILLPRLPRRIQPLAHQIFFLTGSVVAGCYLIHITNKYGYYAVLKQAPPIGCLWIWSVIELDLWCAIASLACCVGFLKYGGYSIR